MAKEYIDKEQVLEAIAERNRNTWNGSLTCLQMKRMCENFPTADVVEVKHGHFENIVNFGNGKCIGFCSECYSEHEASNPTALKFAYRYCRWCGAKMDGERKEQG